MTIVSLWTEAMDLSPTEECFFLLTEYHQMQNHGEDPEVPTEAKSSEQRVIFINQAQPRKYTQNRIW